MILPCEVAVRSVVPAVKALVAQQLVAEHRLKQDQVAEILRISQSAVSKYSRKVRGYALRIDKAGEVQRLIASMTAMLLNGESQRAEFLEIFCETCEEIRKTGIVCQFCKKSDPKIKIDECGFCVELRVAKHRR